MGYACPVCEAPQADGEHLANHLAFTAMLGREDHEAWLDEHAPGWEESDPEALAEEVVDQVPETEFPQIFDDTTHDHDGHDHQHAAPEGTPFEQELAHQTRGAGRGDLTSEAQDVMAEAREMTERMLADDEEDADDSGSDAADASSDPADESERDDANDNE